MRMLTHGSLFAGIGGFDLGFERAGFETIWQVEIDEYCRRVLERHFPRAERFADIRDCAGMRYSDGSFPHVLRPVDVITGGFPCQDISEAGRRRGIAGERSGLWSHMWRIICELRPKGVVVENVSALLERGLGRIIGDLAEIGYDAEWSVLSACAMGAPHPRERVFIVAYPSEQWSGQRRWFEQPQDCDAKGHLDTWPNQPEPVRVADGISRRMDRLASLGNSVMPQIAQWIAERICQAVSD